MSPATRRFLDLFKPHLPALVLGAALLVLAANVPALVAVLVKVVLDEVLIRQDHRALMVMPFAVAGLYLFSAIVNISRAAITRSVAFRVVQDLRQQLLRHYLRLGVGWHQSVPTGEQVSRITSDCNNVQYAVSGFATAVQKPLSLVALLAAAFWMNPLLAAISLCVLPFVALPIHMFGKRLRRRTRDVLNNMAALSAHANESLSGIRTVQAFGGEEQVAERFHALNSEQYRRQLRAVMAQVVPGPVVEVIAAVGVGAAIYVGGRQVFQGSITPGDLIGFLVALGLMNDPLKGLSLIVSLWQQSYASAEEVFRILDQEPLVEDGGHAVAPTEEAALEFRDVSFDYGEGTVLHRVALAVGPGEVLALVGPSGAGKSTIANLVSRFHDPIGGVILLNGRPLQDYRLASLRRAVALVTQEPFLFNDTVRNNIAFGNLDATPAMVEAAARAANAHDFIAGMPRGYETRVDELGMRLSGGQRQRICIARALLADAPMLVLDEATSALDTESEALVQEALERLMENRTVLVIAHRLSTVRRADRILVLEGGRVVEEGPHQALLDQGGVYARLHGLQG